MFSTLEQYFDSYRVKNGEVPSETTLNRGPFRLKREIRELKSLSDIVIGNDLETWDSNKYYEQDEYIQYNSKVYRSRIDGNHNKTPGVSQDWILIQVVSLKNLLRRIEILEGKVQ